MGMQLKHFRVDTDYLKTMNQLRNLVLKDGELHFFKAHCGSETNWINFVISAGLIKIREDFERFKKIQKVEE